MAWPYIRFENNDVKKENKNKTKKQLNSFVFIIRTQ